MEARRKKNQIFKKIKTNKIYINYSNRLFRMNVIVEFSLNSQTVAGNDMNIQI